MSCLLAVFSVAGAFLGARRSGALFNSPPLMVFWVLLALLLLSGLFSFKRLVRSPGLLASHLGPLLILLGGMWGSEAVQGLRERLFGTERITSGYMAIFEGETSNRVLDEALSHQIGRLPFSLRLNDFRIEYYEAADKTWLLFGTAPPSHEQCEHAKKVEEGEDCQRCEPVQSLIEWTEGREVDVPNTGARLRVLEYLDSAGPVYAEGQTPVLEIIPVEGKKTVVPAEVGREVSLDEPQATVRIVQVFSHLLVRGSGQDREVLDVPDSSENPALKVEIEWLDGAKRHHYVMPRFPMHGQDEDGIELRYRFPEPVGAKADPAGGLPAMKLLLSYEGKEQEEWLIPQEGESHARLSLAPLLGLPETATGGGMDEPPALYLVKPRAQIRDFMSDLVVLEEGEAVAGKVIEVNDPLHYGGYHFYQHSYDDVNESYTVLLVKADSGLWLVYAGFLLLCFGVFWWCWARPSQAYFTGRKDNDH